MKFLDVLTIGSKILDRVLPDPQQKAAAQLELMKLQQAGEFQELDAQLQRDLAQIEVNRAEAASSDLFRGGWRPAVGWICAFGLGYQMLLRPLLGWTAMNLWGWNEPPSLELDTLLTLLFGLLGLGAYRTVERIKGVTAPGR